MDSSRVIDRLIHVNEVAWSFYNSNPDNTPKSNMNTQDVKLLISNLNKHHVEYIVIGGLAMAFHGHVRATEDIDLWIKSTPENMNNLKKALVDSRVKEASSLRDTTQLVGGFTVFSMMESDFQIDLFHALKGFDEKTFDGCLKRATISEYQGSKVPVLSAVDLLTNKELVGREKDLADISFLKRMLSRDKSTGKDKNPGIGM